MKSTRFAVGLAAFAGLAVGVLFFAAPTRQAIAQSGAAAPAPQATRIAVVDIMTLIERIWESDPYKGPRDELVRGLQTQATELRTQMSAIEDKVRAEQAKAGEADPAKPPADNAAIQAGMAEYEAKQQELQGLGARVEESNLKQIKAAYAQLVAACQSKAKAMGYTHVIVSRTSGELITASRPQDAFQEILGRTVIAMPEGDDITMEVMKELKLDAVTLPGATPVPNPEMPAAAPAPTGEKK